MFVLYEKTLSSSGELSLLEVLATSTLSRQGINWKTNDGNILKLLNAVFKQPPVSARSCDEKTHIWSFLYPYGEAVLSSLRTPPLSGFYELYEIPDIKAQAIRGWFKIEKEREAQRPEDFFYNPTPPPVTSSAKSRDQIQEELGALLGISPKDFSVLSEKDLKAVYRKAALRLHPDRNNGDSAAMTELNYLWQVYHG